MDAPDGDDGGVEDVDRRVTRVWKAPTMAQATGTGSLAWCGMAAWPPRPTTSMTNSSAEAIRGPALVAIRSEEHTSELQSLMRNSYAVFCLKKKTQHTHKA